MTLEAIHLYPGIGVATLAELAWCIDRDRLAILVIADVTVYALDQAVFLCTYPFVHGIVALMQKKLHMVLTHDLGRLDASLRCADLVARPWQIRQRHPAIGRGRCHGKRSEQD